LKKITTNPNSAGWVAVFRLGEESKRAFMIRNGTASLKSPRYARVRVGAHVLPFLAVLFGKENLQGSSREQKGSGGRFDK